MSDESLLRTVAAYYAGRLLEHGETARGVDWNSESSQALRFDTLLELCRGGDGFSLLELLRARRELRAAEVLSLPRTSPR